MSDIDAFETMHTCRAIRYLKPDPVPDELIRKILDAAIRAPSGSNRQSWHFLVIKDAATRKMIQERYKRAFDFYTQFTSTTPPREGVAQVTMDRVRKSAAHLADHMHEAPVLLMPLLVNEQRPLRGDGPLQSMVRKSIDSSIYPAV